jgi:DNA adenine methylase
VSDLRAPFPWFGGKMPAAELVWDRFGEVVNYVEPFFGSGAVLLGRPHAPTIETVNDIDGHIVNFWRAIQGDPEAVAAAADWPVQELELHARHKYLTKVKRKLATRLLEDPTYFNATIAGWWVWGLCAWIGSGWCSGTKAVQLPPLTHAGQGVHARGMRQQLPDLGGPGGTRGEFPAFGRGVHRGDMRSAGQLPALVGGSGNGPSPKDGMGIHGKGSRSRLPEVFTALAARLRYTRVTCGDFERILSPAVTWRHGLTGVFLDPPYPADAGSTGGLYTSAKEEREVFDRAFRWALANGGDKRLWIAFCYYEGTMVDGRDVSAEFRVAAGTSCRGKLEAGTLGRATRGT